MADRTVRAIFEARVSGAQKAMRDLATDVDKAGRKVDDLDKDLKSLDTVTAKPKVDADTKAALGDLGKVESDVKALDGTTADLKVDADTSAARDEIDSLGDEGSKAGEDAGEGLSKGIIAALATIPIAGAIVGIGAAIGGALLQGIQDGLAVEATQDLFSARTGLDEDTARKFARAAGEAYANVFGESVATNLDTARLALQNGLIDENATQAEVQKVIEQLSGITEVFEYDIPQAATAVGNMIKTGLVADAEEAFDLITVASQNVFAEDLMDTLTEYSGSFFQLGLDGQAAMSAIISAMDSGARNTDVVADAFKEMGLRIREEGTTVADDVRAALESIGLDADRVLGAIRDGGPESEQAIQDIFTALKDTEAQGGNTQNAITALFGGPGEDLATAIFGVNLSLAETEGSAGAAQRALDTWADNAATKIEEAKRNIDLAVQGIQGALASAFSDEIAGAADWVSKNRAPLMEFMLEVVNGAFEMGGGFVEFGATALNAIADVIDGLAQLIDSLPGDQSELKESMMGIADGLREGADTMETDWTAALDGMQAKANEWAAPAIMDARVNDAIAAMMEDMDRFATKVEESGGEITINGSTLNAEEALQLLIGNINEEDGTVTINGEKVPAEKALDTLLAIVNSSEGAVTVGADDEPARQRLNDAMKAVREAEEDITINGDTEEARKRLEEAKEAVRRAEAAMKVSADIAAAEAKINNLARDRSLTITANVRVTGSNLSAIPTHDGGWTGRLPGRNAGGWVPGDDPGYDNILWPLYTGGTVLNQPLAGDEFVVNSTDARFWGPLLEWMNAGGRPPASSQESGGFPSHITLVDESGGILTRARVVAGQEVRAFEQTRRRVAR